MITVVTPLVPAAAASAPDDAAPAVASTPDDPAPWLDVPFVAQTPALCGGAAVAMVAHYWGDADVHAQDFASLIDDRAEGIRVDHLSAAMTARGWTAWSARGSPAFVRRHLERGRPLIALIEARPDVLHYVVVVAWAGNRVVVHDPARGPYQVLEEAAFRRAWRPTGFLTMLLLPPPAGAAVPRPPLSVGGRSSCDRQVARAVELARAGEPRAAAGVLEQAVVACPDAAAAWRELAALRLQASKAHEAVGLATRAVRHDPADRYAWRVLAVSRFLTGDPSRALDAWNRLDEPRVDLVPIDGLRATRPSLVNGWLGFRSREMITVDRVRHARRRLALLPSLSDARLAYRPRPGGRADVEVFVRERPLMFDGAADALWTAARAAIERQARVAVSSPTGGGEVWTGAWRWERHRPRIAVGFAVPQLAGGVWRLQAGWEAQHFGGEAAGARAAATVERRRGVSFQVEDWMTPAIRMTAGAGFDDWADRGRHLSLRLGLATQDAGDRRAIRAAARVWLPLAENATFATWHVGMASRVGTAAARPQLRVRLGAHGATRRSPRMVWPRADTGRAGTVPLRAHPGLDGGIVRTDRLGRLLVGASVELEHPAGHVGPLGLATVVFADMARVWQPLDGGRTLRPLQIDVGGGLRLDVPGRRGRLRLDVGRGLRDGDTVVSTGWSLPWPGW